MRVRHILGALALCMLALAASGCGPIQTGQPRVQIAVLERSLEAATDIDLTEERRVETPFSLSSLASTRSGVAGGETMLVLEFFSHEATAKAVGRARNLGATVVVRERNIVVLYTRRPGAPNHLAAIRQALRAAPMIR